MYVSNATNFHCGWIVLQCRKTDSDYAPLGQTAYSDGYPFFIISLESLDFLNQKLETKVQMANFRPNIVVSNCSPFSEDIWSQIEFYDAKKNAYPMKMNVVKPCSRCQIPSIDPDTGKKYNGSELTKVMKSFRQGHHLKHNSIKTDTKQEV